MIVKPGGKDVTDEQMRNGFDANPDGGGYCWSMDGKVWYRKGIMNADEFVSSYRQDVGDRPALLHFRMATHGGITYENCHPFDVGNGMMMAHNGIIQIKTEPGESDTRAFLKSRIAPVLTTKPDAIRCDAWKGDISREIGFSKLGFLCPDGEQHIIGEKLGSWEGGVWFSNGSHKASQWGCSGGGYGWSMRDIDDERWYEENGVALSPKEADMDDPEILDTDALSCDLCGGRVIGRFTIDRRSSVIACNHCVSTKKTYKLMY